MHAAPPIADLGSTLVGSLPAISLLVAATAYAVRVLHLSADGRPVPLRRQVAFLAGLIVIGVALVSPLDGLADELLTFHMIQHLLIMDVAALLIVFGLTGPVMQPLLAMRGFRWVRHLGNPLVALAIWTVLLYVWHIPALYEAATFDSDLVHALQHSSFFLAGLAFWMSLFGPLPKPAWFGGRRDRRLRRRGPPDRGGARQRPDVVGLGDLRRTTGRARPSAGWTRSATRAPPAW